MAKRNNTGQDAIYRVMYEMTVSEYATMMSHLEDRHRRAATLMPDGRPSAVRQVAGPYSTLAVAKGQLTASKNSRARWGRPDQQGEHFIEKSDLKWERI